MMCSLSSEAAINCITIEVGVSKIVVRQTLCVLDWVAFSVLAGGDGESPVIEAHANKDPGMLAMRRKGAVRLRWRMEQTSIDTACNIAGLAT